MRFNSRGKQDWVKRFAYLPRLVGTVNGRPYWVWWEPYLRRGPSFAREYTLEEKPKGFVNGIFSSVGP